MGKTSQIYGACSLRSILIKSKGGSLYRR
uniref:Uncharacterized protein n=1 Tax=Lepeophtheirus salmonis TaxID=72036 RepID=A0A0K2TRT6_LEPSM